MIDQATIDRILDAAQIVDVVSEFVTLRRRGVNYHPVKDSANVSVAAKAVTWYISSWNTNSFHITKH